MSSPSQLVSYVADPPRSALLYEQLLGTPPFARTPLYATFVLPGGLILALWARDSVKPRATLPGGTELGFPVGSEEAVLATHEHWLALGLRIIQEPVRMEFGLTFTAADPDGHRLRVFSPPPG